MKILLPLIFLFFSTMCQSQTKSFQIGAMTSLFGHGEAGVGGELAMNIPVQKKFTIGPGVQFLKINIEPNLYVPVFAALKFILPSKKTYYFFHADAGYHFHNFHNNYSDTVDNGTFNFNFKNSGGFYFGSGAGIKLKCKNAPYINFQYSLYRLKFVTSSKEINQSKAVVYTDKQTAASFTITAGIWIN